MGSGLLWPPYIVTYWPHWNSYIPGVRDAWFLVGSVLVSCSLSTRQTKTSQRRVSCYPDAPCSNITRFLSTLSTLTDALVRVVLLSPYAYRLFFFYPNTTSLALRFELNGENANVFRSLYEGRSRAGILRTSNIIQMFYIYTRCNMDLINVMSK
jgi:hypothetical protein